MPDNHSQTANKLLPRDIRLVALDLDGTTLNAKKQVPPAVGAAIAQAIAAGIDVFPATGRMLAGIPPLVYEWPGVKYAICSNGAKVYDITTQEELYSNCLSPQKTAQLLGELAGYDCCPSVYMEGKAYTGPVDYDDYAVLFPAEMRHYAETSRTVVADLSAFVLAGGLAVEKINVMFKTLPEHARCWQVYEGRADCALTTAMAGNLELNAPGVHKGAALLWLGAHLGCDRRQLMAIGDGENDVDMLAAAGWAVAVENAIPAVKAEADIVVPSCEEDGVAVALAAVMPRER